MAKMGLLYPKRPLLPLKLLIAFNSAKKGFLGNSDPSRTPKQFSAMPQHERHALISSFCWHYCCNMTTRQNQRATKYLSKVSREKKLLTEGGGGGERAGKNQMKINTASYRLEKQTSFPPASSSVLASHRDLAKAEDLFLAVLWPIIPQFTEEPSSWVMRWADAWGRETLRLLELLRLPESPLWPVKHTSFCGLGSRDRRKPGLVTSFGWIPDTLKKSGWRILHHHHLLQKNQP